MQEAELTELIISGDQIVMKREAETLIPLTELNDDGEKQEEQKEHEEQEDLYSPPTSPEELDAQLSNLGKIK